jgi:hypothetical protein
MAAVAALAPAAVWCWCNSAQAYRPFDGTDAAVADTGEVEIELGPVEYQREGAERTLLAPNLRVNYGFRPDWEASVEGDLTHALSPNLPATTLVGNIVSLKTVLREGTLQQKPGPSVATEFDVLLPGIRDEPGAGVGLIGIVSQRWDWITLHFNAGAALTRDQHADYVLDTIVEGPHDWPVRPVSEFFYERNVSQFETRSGLIGANLAGQRQYRTGYRGTRRAHQRSHRGRDPCRRDLRLRCDEGTDPLVGIYRAGVVQSSLTGRS